MHLALDADKRKIVMIKAEAMDSRWDVLNQKSQSGETLYKPNQRKALFLEFCNIAVDTELLIDQKLGRVEAPTSKQIGI